MNNLDEIIYFDNQDDVLLNNVKNESDLLLTFEKVNENLPIYNASQFVGNILVNGEILKTVSVVNSMLRAILVSTGISNIEELTLDSTESEFYCKLGNKDRFVKLAKKINYFDKFMNEITILIERIK